jgi:hypothetical protein
MPGPRWGRARSSQPIPRAIQSRATRASPHPNDHAPWSPPRASHLIRVSTPAILPRRHPRQPARSRTQMASLARTPLPTMIPNHPTGDPARPPPAATTGQPEQTTGPLADTTGDHAGAGRSQPRGAALPHRRSTNQPWRRQGRTRTQDARTPDTRRPDTGTPATGHPDTRARGHGTGRRTAQRAFGHPPPHDHEDWTPDRSTWGAGACEPQSMGCGSLGVTGWSVLFRRE